MQQELADYLNKEATKLKAEQRLEHECQCGCPVLQRNVMDRVYCSKIVGQDVVGIYRKGVLIGNMEDDPEVVGSPRITFFSHSFVPLELTFGDFEILRKSWKVLGNHINV